MNKYICGRVQICDLGNKSHARNAQERKRSAGRLVAVYCVRIIAVIAIVLIALLLLAARPKQTYIWKAYTISSGETLWEIARNEYGYAVDIRKVISEICAENDIMPDKLRPGDVILIPVEAE